MYIPRRWRKHKKYKIERYYSSPLGYHNQVICLECQSHALSVGALEHHGLCMTGKHDELQRKAIEKRTAELLDLGKPDEAVKVLEEWQDINRTPLPGHIDKVFNNYGSGGADC